MGWSLVLKGHLEEVVIQEINFSSPSFMSQEHLSFIPSALVVQKHLSLRDKVAGQFVFTSLNHQFFIAE